MLLFLLLPLFHVKRPLDGETCVSVSVHVSRETDPPPCVSDLGCLGWTPFMILVIRLTPKQKRKHKCLGYLGYDQDNG